MKLIFFQHVFFHYIQKNWCCCISTCCFSLRTVSLICYWISIDKLWWFLGVADTNDVIQKIEKTLNNTHTTIQKLTNNSFRHTKKHPKLWYTFVTGTYRETSWLNKSCNGNTYVKKEKVSPTCFQQAYLLSPIIKPLFYFRSQTENKILNWKLTYL